MYKNIENDLIGYLLQERKDRNRYDISGENAPRIWRSLVNVRPPMPISEAYLIKEDEYLQGLLSAKGVVDAETLPYDEEGFTIWKGDITRLKADAIVNAANSALLGCFAPCHTCIDNCIHTFAGVRLRLECARIMEEQGHDERTGQAKITPGYNLPCKYVLHTVGPIVDDEVTEKNREDLRSCYENCLRVAEENGVKSIAFCCISTGVFRFPNEEAAEIAVRTVRAYKERTGSGIKVIFNVFKEVDHEIYAKLLG